MVKPHEVSLHRLLNLWGRIFYLCRKRDKCSSPMKVAFIDYSTHEGAYSINSLKIKECLQLASDKVNERCKWLNHKGSPVTWFFQSLLTPVNYVCDGEPKSIHPSNNHTDWYDELNTVLVGLSRQTTNSSHISLTTHTWSLNYRYRHYWQNWVQYNHLANWPTLKPEIWDGLELTCCKHINPFSSA